MSPSSGPNFKIKLETGRVLGPLDLERVRRLVRKGIVKGGELAREHPKGEWRDIALIPALAEIFLKVAQDRIDRSRAGGTRRGGSEENPQVEPAGPTQILPENRGLLPGAGDGRTVALTEVSVPGRKRRREDETTLPVDKTEEAIEPTLVTQGPPMTDGTAAVSQEQELELDLPAGEAGKTA